MKSAPDLPFCSCSQPNRPGCKCCNACGLRLALSPQPVLSEGENHSKHDEKLKSNLQKRCEWIGAAIFLVPFGAMGLSFFFGTLSFGFSVKACILATGILAICLGTRYVLGKGLGDWA